MRFADRFNDVISQWEQVHGTRMTNRALAFRVTQAGHPVSATYLSQLRSGNRDNPSQALVETVARVLAVESTRFNDGGPGDPAPGDDLVSSALDDPALRRLLTTAAGLSASSIELLSDVAAKLRLAEGLAPGTTAQL
ncbi:Nucleoid-associated protein EspR [Nocardia cerradoensis]|uniref:Nucleoid-associated protein EspR n=1 Tax=Nocardia cerradoensis TaxID=85688 RepID=A0A231HB67_9NOCA|nr:transcriptional regulator [Nocardia cerradoensis]OXR45967.1 Nucleoid-associated protein EspR [Nocardia cerradoensis]